ncbi:MAG: hypothetical protein SNJ79_01335 [Sphingomonadaceae bacterium]
MSVVTLVELKPRLAATGAPVSLRYCHNARVSGRFLGQQWLTGIVSLPEVDVDLGFDGERFGQGARPQLGQLVLADGENALASYVWPNADVEIRVAPWPAASLDPNDSDFGAALPLRVERMELRKGLASLVLIDRAKDLTRPVAALRFGNSGIALLDSADTRDLAGRPVPVGWGPLLSVPGYLVDRANNIWLMLGRPSTSIQAFYDGGAAFTPGQARASLAALIANTPADGTVDWVLDHAGLTLARPWTEPAYPFTADLTAVGPATAAGIAHAIVSARTGLAFVAGTVAAFDALYPALNGLYIDNEADIAAALDRLMTGLGAFWRVTSAGTIALGRLQAATPAKTFGITEIVSIERAGIVMPTRSRAVGYARNNRLHSEGEIALLILEGIDGEDAPSGYLTNEAHTVPATADGVVTSFGGAAGNFRVFLGTTEITSACTFALAPSGNPQGLAQSITSAGAYSVTGAGSWANSSDLATVTYRATVPSGPSIDKVFTLTKSRAGEDGEDGEGGVVDAFLYATREQLGQRWQALGPGSSGELVLASKFAALTGLANSPGGRAVRIGENAGDDWVSLIYREPLPIDQEDLYCIEWDVEHPQNGNNARISLGIAAYDAAGNILPANGSFSAVAASDVAQLVGRTTYRGYFQGVASSGFAVAPNIEDPSPLPLTAVSVAPAAVVQFRDTGTSQGQTILHSVKVWRVSDFTPIPVGAWSSTRTYSTGQTVTFSGSSFMSRRNGNLNNQPPATGSNTWWLRLAEKGEDGLPGAAGLNSAPVMIYRRAASSPALPTANATYTFATGAITGLNNGWSATVPAANGQPLWVSHASASSTGATDTIAPSEWSTPAIMAEDGVDGAAGGNTAVAYLYQRAASAPGAPTGTLTYTFATGALSGTPGNGWATTIPATNGQPLWVRTAVAFGTGATDTIDPSEWSASVRLVEDGATGLTGGQVLWIFRRSATQPNTPSPSSTIPSGWYDLTTSVPPAPEPMWASPGNRPAGDTIYTWGTPIRSEAVSGIGTGEWQYLTETVSPEITFTLQDGESRIVRGQASYLGSTVAGSVYVQIEFGQVGGGWTASNGNAVNFTPPDPVVATHQITVTNSSGVARPYRVRGTIVIVSGNPGTRTANESVLAT